MTKIIICTIFFSITLTFSQCSMNGKDVIPRDEYIKSMRIALSIKAYQCRPYTDSSPNQIDIGGEILKIKLFEADFLGGFDPFPDLRIFGKEYYTKKDRDICLSSIYSIPCYAEIKEQNIALATQALLYCEPDVASAWDSHHPLQGDLLSQ